MKISICLPVMGRGRMLARALYSIFMQDYRDIEIVIKDGNETPYFFHDDPDIQGALHAQIPGVTVNYSCGKDGGIFPAANDCLKRATGDILYFMCSDDLLCPGTLQTVNDEFEKDRFGGAMWVYGQTISADVLGRMQGIDGAPPNRNLMWQHNCIGQPSVFWNRQMMELAGNFDTRYKHAADYDLWLRFWKKRDPVYIHRTLGVFCHHENQNTEVYRDAVHVEEQKILNRHKLLGDMMDRARTALILKTVYDGDSIPPSHDEQ